MKCWAYLFVLSATLAAQGPARIDVSITPEDIAKANEVIRRRTMSMPGFTPGSRVENGPGAFSAADAAVLFGIKYGRRYQRCIPVNTFGDILDRVADADLHKMAALRFWADYCKTHRFDAAGAAANDRENARLAQSMPDVFDADPLKNDFTTYISVKVTERTRVVVHRLSGAVGAEAAWRRAMESDQSFRNSVAEAEKRTQTAHADNLKQLEMDWIAKEIAEATGAARTR